MNNQNRKKAVNLYFITILFPVLYMFFGWDLANYLKDLGIAPIKMYYIFFLIILPAISFIWSIPFGYLWEKFEKKDYFIPIVGSPGWVLNVFIKPQKMSVRIYSGIITALFVLMGLRIGVFIKNNLKISSKFSRPKMSIDKNTFFLIGWIIIICSYFICILTEILDFKSSYSVLLLIIINIIIWASNCYFTKRKIRRLKQKLGILGDLSLKELEGLRIEKDYQENFVGKLHL